MEVLRASWEGVELSRGGDEIPIRAVAEGAERSGTG